jgi:hypothetical protein
LLVPSRHTTRFRATPILPPVRGSTQRPSMARNAPSDD